MDLSCVFLARERMPRFARAQMIVVRAEHDPLRFGRRSRRRGKICEYVARCAALAHDFGPDGYSRPRHIEAARGGTSGIVRILKLLERAAAAGKERGGGFGA